MATGLLALGDSYTIGEGVEAAATWPLRLAQQLSLARPDVVARTGWSADELLAALDGAALSPPYALVTLLVGVNDQYRGHELAEHLPHFNVLLSQAVAFADGDPGRVLVVSIPDWGVTPFAAADARGGAAIAGQIDAYNAAQRELCALRDIAWVDVTAASRTCGADPAMLVGDGLHPSALQYEAWLQVIAPAARRCLAAG